MDQHLLPPYAQTTMDLKTPPGKLPTRFYQPLAPKSTAPKNGDERRSDHCSGGLCRTIVLCVLALAVCCGFILLYLQMRNLEQQVRELRELTYEGGSYGPFDEGETEPEWSFHSKDHNKNRDRFSDSPDVDHDDTTQHNEHTRERRSTRHIRNPHRSSHHGHGMQQVGESSAHVVPLSEDPSTSQPYPISAWFTWTDQATAISHASIPLHSSGKYLIAPHAGYYYIYSQVTIKSCNNRTDGMARGHSLYVKTMCGENPGNELTHTITTPYIRNNSPCSHDSGYIGGVYYLEKYDFVGVKPYVQLGYIQSNINLKQTNSYFGMILISKFPRAYQRCPRPMLI